MTGDNPIAVRAPRRRSPASASAAPAATSAASAAAAAAAAGGGAPDAPPPGAPTFHAVSPLSTCPHLRTSVKVLPTGAPPSGASCAECGARGEVWACLSCGHAGCGRHGCGRATAHAAESGHALALGWADLSVWCYKCDAYLNTLTIGALQRAREAATAVRFPPTAEAAAAAAAAPPPLSKADETLLRATADTAEYFQTASAARAAARELASLFAASGHSVVFTGAGISTSAGMPDYRGTAGIDVIAELGEAVQPSAKAAKRAKGGKGSAADDPAIAASREYLDLSPTRAHRVLVALHTARKLHYVITQNCDGLHVRSGIPRSDVAEVHGSVFVEYCDTCSVEYVRPYCVDLFSTSCENEPWYVACGACGFNHFTGRLCEAKGCKGKLRDTIINFSDNLHDKVCGGILRAEEECRKADLVLCLGSSLTVTPASELPQLTRARKGNIAIVNLQATAHDGRAAIRVYYPLDEFMARLEEEMLPVVGGGSAISSGSGSSSSGGGGGGGAARLGSGGRSAC